jgi:hypothetical protein
MIGSASPPGSRRSRAATSYPLSPGGPTQEHDARPIPPGRRRSGQVLRCLAVTASGNRTVKRLPRPGPALSAEDFTAMRLDLLLCDGEPDSKTAFSFEAECCLSRPGFFVRPSGERADRRARLEGGIGRCILRRMRKARFEAALFEGHKAVTAVIVPFDPEEVWGLKPVRLASRRDGWLVKGTVNGTRFEGYIGFRWARFFIIIEAELRSAAKLFVGDTLSVVVEPTTTLKALAKARKQSEAATAPSRNRADAIELPPARSRKKTPGSRR